MDNKSFKIMEKKGNQSLDSSSYDLSDPLLLNFWKLKIGYNKLRIKPNQNKNQTESNDNKLLHLYQKSDS